MNALRICLLGPLQVWRAEELVNTNLSKKARGLLAYLVMCPSGGFTREKLAGLFWGETDEEHAQFNLRRALWSLRKAINPPGAPSDMYIYYKEGHYSFNRSSDYWLDVNGFERAVDTDSHHRITMTLCSSSYSKPFDSPSRENLRDAIRLYRGDLLEGCSPNGCPYFMDWLLFERNRLEHHYVKCLHLLAVDSAIRNDYRQAVSDYQQVLRVDPLYEKTHKDLMVAYCMLGERDKAVEQYHDFRRMLRQQLDLEPLPETQVLYREIRDSTLEVKGSSYWLTSTQKITTQTVLSGPFVGRKREQIKLSQALNSARQAGGCMAVIIGEAGVGKTRLIDEFLYKKSDSPLAILRARCYAQEQGLPYQPIIDALRTYLSNADFSYIKGLSNIWLAEVAKILPELHNYFPSLPISLALFPDQERNRLFEGLAQFITHLSLREPLVLVLDDLHAADVPTFDLIHYLARCLTSARVFIICSLRQEALTNRPRLAGLLRELTRSGQQVNIPLERLSEAEVLELISRIIGASVESEELGRRLYLETGGNAFFLVEMLKASQELPDASLDDLPVPSSVSDVIHHRLNRLDDDSRRVISIAAVIGRQFKLTTIQQVYAGDKQDLLNILDRLLSRGWIVEPPGANPGIYDFSHGLVREVVYETLRTDWRLELHRQVGLALESTISDQEELAGVLAHHFWKANDVDRALRYSLQAASHARRLYAAREAIAHYRRILDIANRSDDILSTAEWLEIQCQLGQSYEFLGKYDAAIAVYEAALPDTLSEPIHRRICFQLAIAYDRKGEYDKALEHLGAIGAYLPEPEDSASRIEAAMIARGRARVYLHREQSYEALAFCRQALDLIEDNDSEDEEIPLVSQMAAEQVAIYEIIANSYFHLGNYETAINHCQQALDIALRQDQRPAAARLLIGLGKVAHRRGKYVQAEAYAQQCLDICHGIGHIAGEAASLVLLGDVAYNRGDFSQAIPCYENAFSSFRQFGDQHGIADCCLSLAFVKIDIGKIDEAENHLQEALTIGHNLNATLVLIRAQYHLARVSRARGRLDQARARVERAIEAAQQAGILLLEAAGHHLLGDILLQQQQLTLGETHIIEGLRLFESLGDRFETAWTLRSYARLLADRGDLPHAWSQLQRAADIFAELEAQRELTRTNVELARLQADHK